MRYSCTHMATVGDKGLTWPYIQLFSPGTLNPYTVPYRVVSYRMTVVYSWRRRSKEVPRIWHKACILPWQRLPVSR